jgi:hypothetical protein
VNKLKQVMNNMPKHLKQLEAGRRQPKNRNNGAKPHAYWLRASLGLALIKDQSGAHEVIAVSSAIHCVLDLVMNNPNRLAHLGRGAQMRMHGGKHCAHRGLQLTQKQNCFSVISAHIQQRACANNSNSATKTIALGPKVAVRESDHEEFAVPAVGDRFGHTKHRRAER